MKWPHLAAYVLRFVVCACSISLLSSCASRVNVDRSACDVSATQAPGSQRTALDREILFRENGRLRDFFFGYTSLITNAYVGNLSGVRKAIANGDDVNWKMYWGLTALMWAADQGHADVVAELLDRGADIDAQAEDGTTALMLATRENRSDVITLLLKRHADLRLTDTEGRTAADWAQRAGNIALAKRLGITDNPGK